MTKPHRSASIDALYRNIQTVWPGTEIGWIGDLAHQGEVSGHNPDDYPGLQAEQVDSDTDPEVRALDPMIGPTFTADDAQHLVHALISGPDRNRLYYVIYNRVIYKKSNDFKPRPYTGTDPHITHPHVSGLAADDANGADWTSVLALEDFMATISQDAWDALIWRVKALIDNSETVQGGPKAGEENKLHTKLAELEAKLDQVLAWENTGIEIPAVVDLSDASVAKVADAVNDAAAARLTD